MNGTAQDQIRGAAARLIDQARARGNRLSPNDAEEAVRAMLTLRARGIQTTPAAAATAVAAVDREAIRHLTTICRVLPSLGKDPTQLKAALEGHFQPENISAEAIMPAELMRSRAAPRGIVPAETGVVSYSY